MLACFVEMERNQLLCRCPSYGGPRCAACEAYDAAADRLRQLFKLEPWEEPYTTTTEGEGPQYRAAHARYWALRNAERLARRLRREREERELASAAFKSNHSELASLKPEPESQNPRRDTDATQKI
jgi:hypothetical protein